jgi:tetratricopeptide (TPR) repeat protein
MGPLVQLIDAQLRDDHADLSVQFACQVRYITHAPTSRGAHVTIGFRLGPDCGTQFGTIAPELPLVGGGGSLVTGARVDSIVPGEINLEFTFAHTVDFVMAPSASGLGFKLRLLNTNARKGKAYVSEVDTHTSYSVNLDASQAPIPREALEAAANALGSQSYVSETDVGDEHWYRLRVGPFATRQEAQRVLDAATGAYPRAWLAVDDEQTELEVVDRAGVAPPPSRPEDPALPDPERTRLLREARLALEQQRYAEAVDRLGQLLRQPEYAGRADAQELMGLARERAGQLAQAKAEYGEYLRRYPDGAAATRIRARLAALAAASLAPKSMGEYDGSTKNRATIAGSAAVSWQYGKDQTVSSGTATTTHTLDSALVYGDLLLRDQGKRYDFTGRVDGGYTHNIGTTSTGGSQDRLTAAYAEVTDRLAGLTVRGGRQSLASQGIIGLFDGIFAGYQANSSWSIGAAAGLPAYTSYSALSGQQKFGTVTAEFDPFHQAWVFDAYLFDQTNGGLTERRSVGLQTRYAQAGRTAVALIDYDLEFRALNSVTLIGNTRVGESWLLGFDLDHRRSPLLELSNALIGQSTPDLQALASALHLDTAQLRQLALDRTASSNTVVISASRPLGERWQFMADLSGINLSGTPASGGVTATQSPGLDKSLALQLSGASLLQAGDLHIFSIRVDDSATTRSESVSWDARFVLPGAWRLGPRFSVERLDDPALGGRQMLYLPQVRGDYTTRRSVFEVSAGYQLQNQQALQQQATLTGQPVMTTVNERSLYLSAAYRVRF